MLGGPFCSLLFHDGLKFEERGESDSASCSSDIKGGVCGKSKERAEFSGEGISEIVPGVFIVKDAAIWRLS